MESFFQLNCGTSPVNFFPFSGWANDASFVGKGVFKGDEAQIYNYLTATAHCASGD